MKTTTRTAISVLLSILLLFSACAPKTEDFFLPNTNSNADANTYLPGIELIDLKKSTQAKASFDRTVYMEGGDEALFMGGMSLPTILDAHNGKLFMYRNYPRDIAVIAGDFVRSAETKTQVEVYDNVAIDVSTDTPTRMIDLQGLGEKHVIAHDIIVDADGIVLFLSTCDFKADGTPNFATGEDGVYHFDFDGKLVSSQPASLSQGYSPLNLVRAGSESFMLVSDIVSLETPKNMSTAESAIHTMQQQDYRRLCEVNPERGTLTPLVREGMENAALLGAMSYPDGRILCVDFVVREVDISAACAVQISLYSPIDGETEVLTYVYTEKNEYIAPQMTYDETTDTLFFFQNNELRAWQLGTSGPIAQLTVVDRVQAYDNLCAIDGILLYMTKNMQVEGFFNIVTPKGMRLFEEDADKIAYGIGQNTQLAILVSSYEKALSSPLLSDSALGKGCEVLDYIERYCASQNQQGFTLVPTFLGEDPYQERADDSIPAQAYFDTVAKKLLAGDDDFDLFFIGGNSSYSHSLSFLNGAIKNGYLYPLNELGLEPLFDEMLPGIKNLSSANGQILLVPISLDFTGFMLEPEVLQALGITADDFPHTAAEFITFMDTYSEAISDAGYVMLEPYGASSMRAMTQAQYVTQFNENESGTQEMWDIRMKLLEACYAYQDTIDGDTMAVYEQFSGTLALCADTYGRNMVFGMRQKWDYMNSRSWKYRPQVPVPLLTEDAKYPLESSIFIGVNPNSKNLDAVAEFLSIYLSREYIDYALEESQMLKSADDFKLSGGNKMITTALYDLPQLDPELYPTFVYYKEMLQNATRGYPRHLDYPQFEDFLAGNLSGEEWKKIVDRELEFLRDE